MSDKLLPWEYDLEICRHYFMESSYDTYMNIACELMNSIGFPKSEQAQLFYDMALRTICQGHPEWKHERAREYLEQALDLQAEMESDDIDNGWKPSPMIAWLDERANDLMEKINKDEQYPYSPSEQATANPEDSSTRMVPTHNPAHTATAELHDVPDSPIGSLSATFSASSLNSSDTSSTNSRSTVVISKTPASTRISNEMILHFGYNPEGKIPFPDPTSDYTPLGDAKESDGDGEAQLTAQLQEPKWYREWRGNSITVSEGPRPLAVSALLARRGRCFCTTVLDVAEANKQILPLEVGEIEIVRGEQCDLEALKHEECCAQLGALDMSDAGDRE